MNKYLVNLKESSLPTRWRKRVEVYILIKGKLLVGYHKGAKKYQPCGGGVEVGQNLEEASKMEAFEELGVRIKNVKLITKETFKVDWYRLQSQGIELTDKIRNRMKIYRGQEIHFLKADFDGIDKKYYGQGRDSMVPTVMSKQQLIKELKNDNWDVSVFRIKLVKML